MKKLIVILLLLPTIAWAGFGYTVVSGGVQAAAPVGIQSPTYFTPNTTDFDGLTYATLNGNSQIVATGATDTIGAALPTGSYWGGCTVMQVGATTGAATLFRGLMKFDLSGLSGKTITAVQLKLKVVSENSTATFQVYKLTRAYATTSHASCEDVNDASAVSWNEYSGTSTWTTAGGDYDATLLASFVSSGTINTWYALTNNATCGGGSTDCLLSYVQAIASGGTDYGLIIKASDEDGDPFTKENIGNDIATDGNRLYLKVTWE